MLQYEENSASKVETRHNQSRISMYVHILCMTRLDFFAFLDTPSNRVLDTKVWGIYTNVEAPTLYTHITHHARVLVIKAYTKNEQGEKETDQIILYLIQYISCQSRNRDRLHTG